jgi:hypothetical protein
MEAIREIVIKRCSELGFEFIDIHRPEGKAYYSVKYKCVCGNTSTTNKQSILKLDRQSVCPKCQNSKNKITFHDLVQEFASHGCQLLLSREDEYQNKRQLLPFVCKCGAKGSILICDLRRGRLCINCAQKRRENTVKALYDGFTNISQVPSIRQKISSSKTKKKTGV